MNGPTLAANEWLPTVLAEHGFLVELRRTMHPIDGSGSAVTTVTLLDVSPRCRTTALAILRSARREERAQVLAVGWSLGASAIRDLIDAGAIDFLRLPAPEFDLVSRVELRMRQATRFEPASEAWPIAGAPELDPITGSLTCIDGSVRLSEREHLLYGVFLENIGKPVTRAELLRQVWGREHAGVHPSNVVDVYVRYLRVKLARVTKSLTIDTVRHVGYVMRATNPEAQGSR